MASREPQCVVVCAWCACSACSSVGSAGSAAKSVVSACAANSRVQQIVMICCARAGAVGAKPNVKRYFFLFTPFNSGGVWCAGKGSGRREQRRGNLMNTLQNPVKVSPRKISTRNAQRGSVKPMATI